jgi:hypothetical protein
MTNIYGQYPRLIWSTSLEAGPQYRVFFTALPAFIASFVFALNCIESSIPAVSVSTPSVFMTRLTTWLLIVASYATAMGQTGVPEASSSPKWKAGLFSSVEQCEKDKSPQASPQAVRTLLIAKTVFIVGEPLVLDPTSKAEQTLKKAFVKWGRFQLVDNAETADLIIVISEYSSSKPTRTERVKEALAIFVGGSAPCTKETPLWAVQEVGPALGQRPTGKLVEDLRKKLTKLEESVRASAAPSPT